MKAIKTLLVGIMMFVSTAMIAQPMNYNAIRNNARFLTDRMAYTLGINNPVLIDDIYRINFDYIYGVNEYLDDVALGYRYDDYMMICEERDYALRMLLGDVLWSRIIGYDYFYRPIMFENHRWRFGIYLHDWDRSRFYFSAPRYYDGGYRGGHFFGGMRPHRGIADRGPGMANWGPRQTTPNRGGHPNGNGGYRGDGNRGNDGHNGNYNGHNGNYNGGYHNNNGNRGDMNRGEGNRGDMNRGGDNNHGNPNAAGSPNRGNFPGGANRGDANRGNTIPSGGANREDMNRGNSRSEGNTRSSSRSGSFGGGSNARSSSGSTSGSYPRGNVSRGGGSSTSRGGGSSRGGVTNGRR